MYNSNSMEEGSLLTIVSEPLNNHRRKKGKDKKRKKKGRKGGSIEIDL